MRQGHPLYPEMTDTHIRQMHLRPERVIDKQSMCIFFSNKAVLDFALFYHMKRLYAKKECSTCCTPMRIHDVNQNESQRLYDPGTIL